MDPHPSEWLMKRNCSLTPRQALAVYALLCTATLGIALIFTLRGAWMVLAFALIETTAVGAALLHYCRHALDHERIRLQEGCLLVERADGTRHLEVKLDPSHARVSLPDAGIRTLVLIEARGVRVEIGRFLTPSARLELVSALRRALGGASLLYTAPGRPL
ncbi:Integral membrane protein [Massilia sp. 9I]|nr:Integral membrane protein [Massilia sp. 9I]